MQRAATPGKLEGTDAVGPPSATIKTGHMKVCPRTCYDVSGDMEGWKTTMLLDSGTEKSLAHGEHGVKLLTISNQSL